MIKYIYKIVFSALFFILIGQLISFSFSIELPSFIHDIPKSVTKTYNNDAIGLTFKYNTSWAISSDSSNVENCILSCLIIMENKNNTNQHLSIFIQNIESFKTQCKCKSLVDFMTVQYNKNLKTKNLTLIKDNQTKLANGTDAWQMEYNTPDKYKNYILWFLNNKFFFEVNYYSKPYDFTKFFTEVKYIINSLQVFQPANKTDNNNKQLSQSPSFISNMTMFPSHSGSNFSIPSINVHSNSLPNLSMGSVNSYSSSNAADNLQSTILPSFTFSKSTTIQDIISIYNSGITFEKFIQQASKDSQSPQASLGQLSAWDAIKYSLSGNANLCNKNDDDLMVNIPGLKKDGYCNILMSFTYETCKAIPSIDECIQDKNNIDTYITNNNLGDKTNDYAFEFLEILSSRLNQSLLNPIDDMIYFSGNHDRNAVAYIEGRLKVIVG